MSKHRTTESLREILFSAIESIVSGEMEIEDGKAIAILSDRIIKSAELEIKFSKMTSDLELKDQGISIGPLLLTKEQ